MLNFLKSKIKDANEKHFFISKIAVFIVIFFVVMGVASTTSLLGVKYYSSIADAEKQVDITPLPPVLDIVAYNDKLIEMANNPIPVVVAVAPVATTPAISNPKVLTVPAKPIVPPTPPKPNLWPVNTVLPNGGALLPFNRIVGYYGNFYSNKMGVLGQYPADVVLQKLKAEVANWQLADPSTPVIPAIDYIAITAQGYPGADGKYRFRMPFDQIDHAIDLAKQVNGIVFLDLQVGLSDVQTEIPLLEKYLKMPQVHLALDPEFAMQTSGKKPGSVIGTLDAVDINFAANYLAALVKENNLTPKILVVHRFTMNMLTNYKKITPLPEVQIVVDEDGWGVSAKKIGTYQLVARNEPVQFTGFKLFYKDDLVAPAMHKLTAAEVLKLSPKPVFIQYQ